MKDFVTTLKREKRKSNSGHQSVVTMLTSEAVNGQLGRGAAHKNPLDIPGVNLSFGNVLKML